MTITLPDGRILHPITDGYLTRHPLGGSFGTPRSRRRAARVAASLSGTMRGDTTKQTFISLRQHNDQVYYWDGPWRVLAGSAGFALVRDGQVVETFTTVRA